MQNGMWVDKSPHCATRRSRQSSRGTNDEEGGTCKSKAVFGATPSMCVRIVAYCAIIPILGFLTNICYPFLTPYTTSAATPTALLAKYAAAATAPLLEVLQAYPPVLTEGPSGALEITDGSTNATVAIVNSNRPECQETLVVHSFAYSYGEPYVGKLRSFKNTKSCIDLGRHLQPTVMFLQPSHMELDRYFGRSTVRPLGNFILWRC